MCILYTSQNGYSVSAFSSLQLFRLGRQSNTSQPSKPHPYNLSPSFNWRAYGYSGLCRSSPKIDHADLERFISNAVGLGLLSPISSPNGGPSQSDGMLADVETVQCKEKEIGCDVLSHQKKKASFHLLHHSSNYIPSFLLRRSGAFSALSSASEVIEHLFA